MFNSMTAWSAMTLLFVPARTLPTVSTANSTGAISRETIICSRITIIAASTTGSTAACGMEPCAPRPNTVMRMLSAADRNGPDGCRVPGRERQHVLGQRDIRLPTSPARPSSIMRAGAVAELFGRLEQRHQGARPVFGPSASSCAAPSRQVT